MPPGAGPSSGYEADSTTPLLQSQDLVNSLPAPILRLLILFAWPISVLRRSLEIVFWKSGRRVESWMVIGAWWGLSLGSTHAFRYLLPPLVFAPLLEPSQLRGRFERSPSPRLITPDSLLVTLSDLHSIHALLPPSPVPSITSAYARFRQLGPLRLVRGLLIIWATWVVVGSLIGFRSLLAIVGTIVLLLPSPPLAHLVNLLEESLAVRRAVALAFLFTFGSPPDHSHPISLQCSPLGWAKSKWATSRRPSLAFSFNPKGNGEPHQSSAASQSENERPGNPIYFRFEVHENQRWWMGLDWTSALLPQERPSWCDSHLLPVSPPQSFPLPPAASIILPAPTRSDPHARVKRIATWRWLDDDWSTVRAGTSGPPQPIASTSQSEPEGDVFSTNSPPTQHSGALEDSASSVRAQSIAEQAFTMGLERLKARTTSPMATQRPPTASPRTSSEMRRRAGSEASDEVKEGDGSVVPVETIAEKDDATDAEGWVYGDNKWENPGARGGLGKFTRRRRWQRRAVCTETVQRLAARPPSPKSVTKATPLAAVSQIKAEPVLRERVEDREEGIIIPPASPTRDDVLRSRLKKAMGSVGG